MTEQIVGSHKESAVMKFLRGQVSRAFNLANQNLRTLDNGGYKVKFNGTIQRLESSDVKIKKTYVDRLDGNKTKKFDQSNIFSHTFTFQEAVEKMPDRSLFSTEVLDVHLHHCIVVCTQSLKRSIFQCNGVSREQPVLNPRICNSSVEHYEDLYLLSIVKTEW